MTLLQRKMLLYVVAFVVFAVVSILFIPILQSHATVVTEHCRKTGEANDDPIVFPNQPGASHLHVFFGTTVTADSTPESLLAQAQTNCDITGDFSGYWNPAIYMDGTRLPQGQIGPYWRDNGKTVVAPPFGMEFVARGWGTNVGFACTTGITSPQTSPTDCTGNGKLKFLVNFPQCWDGLGTAPTSFAYAVNKVCPSGFSTRIAQLNLHIDTAITDGTGHTFTAALSPDGTTGDISTLHADFLDAFTPSVMAGIVNRLNA